MEAADDFAPVVDFIKELRQAIDESSGSGNQPGSAE
jgi:hypothetical protein